MEGNFSDRFEAEKGKKEKMGGGEERSSRLKFNRVSDLLPAPMKAKISNNYRRGISYRFLQARAFHCPRKKAEWNQGRERGGGERGKKKQRRRTKSHRSRHGKAWGRNVGERVVRVGRSSSVTERDDERNACERGKLRSRGDKERGG